MARRYYSSVAVPTTLSSSVTDSATTLPLAASTGFPSSYPFTLIVDEDTAYEEVVTVTASLGGNSFTVTRGSDGTTAQAHSAGAAARHGFSKRDLDEPNEHVNASAAVHGLAGTVVGTSDTQTLSNKTITSPTITTPTLTLKQSASPTPTAEGDIQWDTDDHALKVGDSVGTKTFSDDTVTAALVSAHEADTSTHGVTTVAGLTETQTFTNKTLTTPTITLKQSTTPTPTAEGDIQWDTDDNKLAIGDGAATKIISPDDVAATLTNKTIDGDGNMLSDIAASSIKKSAWMTYTPTVSTHGWDASGSTIEGRYIRIGNTVHFRIEWLLGSCAQGTDNPSVSLPLATRTTTVSGAMYVFNAAYHQPGAFMTMTFAECTAGASTIQLMFQDPGTTYATRSAVTATAPYDWTSTAIFSIHGTYETDAA